MANTEKKLTAVEWLEEQIRYQISNSDKLMPILEKAKQMEKQQITDACLAGEDGSYAEDYFYEAFGKEIPICLNCKFAGKHFELSGVKHTYCMHPKNITSEPLDNLMNGDNLCTLHEFGLIEAGIADEILQTK
jgi:hypothetical protein